MTLKIKCVTKARDFSFSALAVSQCFRLDCFGGKTIPAIMSSAQCRISRSGIRSTGPRLAVSVLK